MGFEPPMLGSAAGLEIESIDDVVYVDGMSYEYHIL
jgi:hypothetical protein